MSLYHVTYEVTYFKREPLLKLTPTLSLTLS